MAGIRVQAGMMVFDGDTTTAEQYSGEQGKTPLKVLVLGDFAGAAPRTQPLLQRKHLRLDADTFEEVFYRLGVAVQLPFDDAPVRFSSLQDMHPDHLYENVSLFNRYRTLRRQLQSPSQFAQAAALLSQEGLIDSSSNQQTSAPAEQKSLLDSVLSGGASAKASGFAEQLIRETIAPYLQPKQHPKVPEYLAAVDLAMAQVMRKVMHADAFQKLESTWRGLDLLQRRVDLDRNCHLHLLDATVAEIMVDISNNPGNFAASALCRNLSQQATEKSPYDIIVLDDILLADHHFQDRITILSALGECTGALVLAGGDSGFVDEVIRPGDSADSWQQLRSSAAAERLFATCPRVLLRLPYGKRTAVIDSFTYEELPEQGCHDYYLWGSGAYLLLLALTQAETATLGACHLENLPLHVYRDSEGDEALKPCAEMYLPETKVNELEAAGFTVLQSVQNSNSAMIQRWKSLKL